MALDFEPLARQPYVVFRLGGSFYAVSALSVKSMTEIPPVISLPTMPDYVRGAINMRGSVLGLTDLRARLGIKSTELERAELLTMLEERERDHVKWLEELERSIVENREFGLQLDPHRCAFGKWYYSYTPPDQWVAGILGGFEAPHNTIHRLATHVKKLQADGRVEEAKRELESTRNNELATMIHLFGELRKQIALSLKEICLVLESGKTLAAFTVDAVESIEDFDLPAFQELDDSARSHERAVMCIVRRRKDDAVVTVLGVPELIGVAGGGN